MGGFAGAYLCSRRRTKRPVLDFEDGGFISFLGFVWCFKVHNMLCYLLHITRFMMRRRSLQPHFATFVPILTLDA